MRDNWGMTNSASRRRVRRQAARHAVAARREAAEALPEDGVLSDSVWAYEVRPVRMGHHYLRLRWYVDRDPYSALTALDVLRRKVLEPLEAALVAQARQEGQSWDDIGFALSITGEGARKKHHAATVELGL